MTYDCFTFFNELDLLEIRLNVLKDVVDKFVIAEATQTHTGKAKSLIFKENKARFSAFEDRIVYIVVDDFPVPSDEHAIRQSSWMRENFQRNAIVRGLTNAKPEDTILISDIDEIPSPAAVLQAKSLPGVTRFEMRFYNFFLNFRNYSVPNWPIGTQACSYATFTDETTYKGFAPDQFVLAEVNQGPTLTKLRMATATTTLRDAGWHFSYCGGVQAIISKLEAFAHTECNTKKATDPEAIKAALLAGRDSVGRGYRFFSEPLDDAFPTYIRENQSRYKELIMPCDADYLRRTKWARMLTLLRGSIYRSMVKCIPPFMAPFAVHVRDWLGELKRGKAKA